MGISKTLDYIKVHRIYHGFGQLPDLFYKRGSSIKGEVKKIHHSSGWSFSCFAAHLFEQDLF